MPVLEKQNFPFGPGGRRGLYQSLVTGDTGHWWQGDGRGDAERRWQERLEGFDAKNTTTIGW